MRILIDIGADDIEALDTLALARDCSRAALIRQAVADFLARRQSGPIEDAFGLWTGTQVDGLAYQQAIRAEW